MSTVMNKPYESIRADGWWKQSGCKSAPATLTAEARRAVTVAENREHKASVVIVVGVSQTTDSHPLTDLAEGGIELSVAQARELARQINVEADYAERFLKKLQRRE